MKWGISRKQKSNAAGWSGGGIACIVLLGSIPLINDFNIHGHDYKYHLYCMEGVAEGLLSGQFPVRIMPNWWNEFGDGAPMFYSDLMLYVPAAITLLGYSIQTAYKCYIVFINFLTAWIAYKSFLKISRNDKIALMGAFLYSLSLYRLIDIYVRCAVGEYTALTFLPLVLLGIYQIEEKNGWLYMAIGLTGCIQSHILVCVMIAFFFLLFSIIKIKWVLKRRVLINFCKTGVVTLLWNLWFIIPFLQMYLSNGYKIHDYETNWKFEEKGIPFQEIFKLYFNGSNEGYFVMGFPLLLGLLLAIIFFISSKNRTFKNSKNKKLQILFRTSAFFALLALFLTMNFIPYSRLGSIHKLINRIINIFEFPFRFMVIASLLSTTAIVSVCTMWKKNSVEEDRRKMKWAVPAIAGSIVALMALGTLMSYWKLLTGEFAYVKNYEYSAIEYIMDMDKWLPLNADQNDVGHELLISSDKVLVTDYAKKYTNIVMDCENREAGDGYVDVPLFYYPCYKAVDLETKKLLPLTYGANERVRVVIPSGYQGTIVLKVSERKLWRIMELVSILSILIILYMIMKDISIDSIVHRFRKGKQVL
ncbi:MAG: YfhO family protein [Lachnospiraceae bacterium]|nr:YfhO family protein [Lachnospiraceae bacterium]